METIHTSDARALALLQKRDTAIDAMAARAAAVPKKIAELNAAFEAKKASMSAAREALLALQSKKKDSELRIAEAEEGIRKHQRELNLVKDNNAFKALLAEIEHDKAAKDELETGVLELLEMIDKASVADRTVQAEVKSIETIMKGETASLEASAAALAAIAPDLLERYEAIRSSRSGLALAAVHEEPVSGKFSCGGCHMGLPPQKKVDVKKADTLTFCPDCRRLIYLEKTLFGA